MRKLRFALQVVPKRRETCDDRFRCLDVGENPLWSLEWGKEENLVRLGHTLQLLRLDTSCLSVRSIHDKEYYFP